MVHERAHLVLAGALGFGCGSVLGIDEPGTDASSAGSSQAGGGSRATGQPSNEGGAAAPGDAGAFGEAVGGVLSAAGSAQTAGTPGLGGSGDGGEVEPEPVFKEPGTRCSASGALGCRKPGLRDRVICRDGTWALDLDLKCDPGQACDRRNGACAEVFCERDSTSCDSLDQAVLRCGPDRVSLTREPCVFGCSRGLGGVCVSPTGDQLVIDRPPTIAPGTELWPLPVISVCVHDLRAREREWRVIRDEANRTWGRYSALSFQGWDECGSAADGAPAQVELSLDVPPRSAPADDDLCVGMLGSIDRHGYPGPGGTLHVHICRSYLDVETRSQEIISDDSVLRFMARHEFGHVMGEWDEGYAEDPYGVMIEAVLKQQMDGLTLLDRNIERLQNTYGPKPSGSLVSAVGACVAAQDTSLTASACDRSAEQVWSLAGGQLRPVSASDTCVQADSEGSTQVGACADAGNGPSSWQAEQVQWRGYRAQCVGVHSETGADSPFAVEACQPFALGSSQSFDFELVANGKLRIRWAGSGGISSCVRAPTDEKDPLGPPQNPVLGPCDGTRDLFDVTSLSQIGVRGYCLAYGQARLILAPCIKDPGQQWFLSGPIHDSEGRVLTLEPDGATFSTTEMGATPSPEQVFDYYF